MSGTWAGNEGHVTVRHTASPMSIKGHSLYCTYYCDPVFISSIVWPILRIYLVFHSLNWYRETCHTKAKKHVKSKEKLCIWSPAKMKKTTTTKYWDTCRKDRQSSVDYRRNSQTSSRPFLPDFFFLVVAHLCRYFFAQIIDSSHALQGDEAD